MFRRRSPDDRNADRPGRSGRPTWANPAFDDLPPSAREFAKVIDGHTVAAGIESWSQYDFAGHVPAFVSMFGHVFFGGRSGVRVLDPIDGTFEARWPTVAAMVDELATEEGQDMHLLAGLVIGARHRGMTLEPHQVWNFVPPPVVGGSFDVETMMPMDVEVSLHLAGQIHAQLRSLPPGTAITGFRIDE